MIAVEVENRSPLDVDTGTAVRVAQAVLADLGFREGELGITFVPTDEIARLNREYLSREGVTDVISFPLDAETSEGQPEGAPVLLGDVVICPEVAGRQAQEHGTTAADELCLLVIHGVLHIAGLDHESDSGEMEARQERLHRELCASHSRREKKE